MTRATLPPPINRRCLYTDHRTGRQCRRYAALRQSGAYADTCHAHRAAFTSNTYPDNQTEPRSPRP